MQTIFDPAEQRVPIKAWLEEIDVGTLEQARNVAQLPFAAHHVALMPDAHLGYGMPIGGVLAADGHVVPNAVGVDIGCGMHARRTNIEAGVLRNRHRGHGTVLNAVLNQVQRDVPAGNGPVGNQRSPRPWLEPLEDLEIVALLESAPLPLQTAWEQSARQLGTLGGGNHFLELQEDEEGFVWLMLHSGSRALGKQVCDHFNQIAATHNAVVDPRSKEAQLAYLPAGSAKGRRTSPGCGSAWPTPWRTDAACWTRAWRLSSRRCAASRRMRTT